MATGVDAKLLKSTKFPPEFSQKVDMTKVNLQVMKKWIAGKISEILGSEDDVVIELCFNLIEGPRFPDIKSLQIQLTGFLDKDTAPFCKELWNLCLSAQTSPQGVPKELLEAKKMELIQEKLEADKAAEESRKRREDFESRRARGGRVDSWRGGRGGDRDSYNGRGRGFGRGRSPSRSPPPSRRGGRDSFRGPARGRDSYMPGGRGPPRRDDRRPVVVVAAGPDLIFGRDPDLLFAERTTTAQALADVHPLPRLYSSADDTPLLEVDPQTSEDDLGQDRLHDHGVHHRAGDVPGTAAVEVSQSLVLGEEKTEADTD
ncbi:hypothetical protein N0V93_001271 [Gnomoniopsis smithogilvyi]|uniref:PWI domain-containing protein n=1 Tax=Gnomoniopsis smithogilvyi TaxID=1191159 RepID=A0A9W8Z5K9_9PEZI|nr:hypothetical protein N0V93_001271 [Gnomoniopsis smithogilvyi]